MSNYRADATWGCLCCGKREDVIEKRGLKRQPVFLCRPCADKWDKAQNEPPLQSSQSTRPRQDVPLKSESCPQGELVNEQTGLVPCPKCGGEGEIYFDPPDSQMCQSCKGTGKLLNTTRVPRPASSPDSEPVEGRHEENDLWE